MRAYVRGRPLAAGPTVERPGDSCDHEQRLLGELARGEPEHLVAGVLVHDVPAMVALERAGGGRGTW